LAGVILVFSTFYMKTMQPLRIIAIASNVAFIVYAILGHLHPVLMLHAALLPLNLLRLYQIRRLLRQVNAVQTGEFSIDALLPYMTVRKFKAGESLFRAGDPATELYVVREGSVRLPEIGVLLKEWDMIGEIGIFARDRKRMASALCETDCKILALTAERALQLYYQNPSFGFYVFQLVIDRLLKDPSGKAVPMDTSAEEAQGV